MHSKVADLPRYHLSEDDSYRSVVWGDMQIGFVTTEQPIDCTDLYADLPGGVCDCAHWGYIIEGSIEARYPRNESEIQNEKACSGEVYYFPPGHVLSYAENTKAIELNHPDQLESLMQRIQPRINVLRRGLK